MLLSTACAPREMGPSSASAPSDPSDRSDPTAASDPSAPSAASAQPTLTDLEVPGFRPSVLVVPPGPGPHPVLVAAHGAGDRGEWQCEWWTPIVGQRAFILCPRGRKLSYMHPGDYGSYFEDHYKLEKEVLAALRALRSAHGSAVDPGPAAYAGYSQGGIMGALFTQKRGDLFSRLALIEGGYAEWDVPTATRFKRAGGQRVLIACGQRYCERGAQRSLARLAQAGVPARLANAPGGGHTYDGLVGQRVIEALPWLFEGDPRWSR